MKKPEFSEFTFGYAFTENLTNGWLGRGVHGVPVFPSLVQEGRITGGYDVAIPTGAEPILFQFKIPQIVTRRSSLLPPRYSPPYYRMHLEPGAKSTQHRALLQHARKGRPVYYVSSRFDRLDLLNEFYRRREVPAHCAFFKPTDLGELDDDGHFVAYQTVGVDAWLFSEPQRSKTTEPQELQTEIFEVTRRAPRTTREPNYFARLASELLSSIEEAANAPVKTRDVERPASDDAYVFEKLRTVEPTQLLAIARSTAEVPDPLDRFVRLATFVLDCHIILVGPRELA